MPRPLLGQAREVQFPSSGYSPAPASPHTTLSLLASLLRTETVTGSDQTNTLYRGLHLIVDITDLHEDTPAITVTIQGKDPVSGKYYTLLASASLATVATTVLRVYPGLTAANNVTANDVLPATWRVVVTHADAKDITYSVGVNLLP